MSEKGTYMVATLVDWQYPEAVDKTYKKLTKLYKKKLGGKKGRKNQLNTFVVTEVTLQTLPDRETRVEVEEETKKILKDYADTIADLHHTEYAKQGDIAKTYRKSFTDIGKAPLFEKYLNSKNEKYTEIEKEIERVGAAGGVIIWAMPGYKGDKLILPELVVRFEGALDESEDLLGVVDEVLIANFARRFLPSSLTIIENANLVFDRLEIFTSKLDKESKIPDELKISLQTFIGVISGIQEVLKLFKREVLKVHLTATEAFDFLGSLPSPELKEWSQIKNPKIGEEIVEHIDKAMDLIVKNKPILRKLLTGKVDLGQALTEELVINLMEVEVEAGGLLVWVHRFQQLPSFSTLDEGIAYEEVEGEAYWPKDKDALIEGQFLFKTFTRGKSYIYALRGVDLNIKQGEFIVIRGPSGAGKTTLLNMLAGLDTPGRGAVFFDGEDVVHMKDKFRSKLRRENFSFIFQSYALIPHLTAFENTKLPLDLTGFSAELVEGIQQLLTDVGIGEFGDHKPALLSGGQMQRLGIARALVNRPKVLFAAEPTGDLDEQTGLSVMELLKKYHEESNMTIVLVTHDEIVAKYATREIFLMDGRIVENLEE